jgi:hypothetical protein
VSENTTWLLLSTNNPGRGPETYGDAKGIYQWNNRVPNAQRILTNHRAIVADNRANTIKALGIISAIDVSTGTSAIDRCPNCHRSSQIRIKRHLSLWGCPGCKNRYSSPIKDEVSTIFYSATIQPYVDYTGHHSYEDIKNAGNKLSQLAMRKLDEHNIPAEIRNEFARISGQLKDLER